MPKPSKARGLSVYGIQWPYDDPIRIELECIKMGGVGYWVKNGEPAGHGLAHHVMAFSRLVWPWFKWHRWSADLHLPELCKPRHRLAVWGPSSTGKSATTALVYLIFYFCRPENTTVILSSTTFDELELRIWGEMKTFFREAKEAAPWLPGHLIDSKHAITTDEKGSEFGRDFRNGVTCRPAKIGNKTLIGSGMSPYMGIKNDYVYVAADEFGVMPMGIMDALINLASNPSCCASFLGNLGDLDTPIGQAGEPKSGWGSLADSDKARVYDTRWFNGRAVQFIGMDSPNLDFPPDAEPYPKIIGRRYIEQCASDYGRDTPLFNMFAGGKIPRGTLENRVLTKAECLRHGAFDPVTWSHEPLVRLYAMDLCYTFDHGDRTVGQPFVFGKDAKGEWRFAPLDKPLVFTPSDSATASLEEQLASQCLAECRKWEIPLANVFFDGTGRSSFTAAIMRLPGGTAVNPVEFGGTATTRPNFLNRRYEEDLDVRRKQGDLLPCNEVFDKMVTELWFALQALVIQNQARNFDEETIKEVEKRFWSRTAGNRISVEPKKEMKLRLGRSPDLGDTLCVAVEGARRLGFPLGKLATATKSNSQWLRRFNREWMDARAAVELAA